MPITIDTTTAPVVTGAPTTTVPPTTATTAQVAAHQSAVQDAIVALQNLPHTVTNDTQFLNLQAQSLATWVSAKHMKTRLLETIGITAAVSSFLTYLLSHI